MKSLKDKLRNKILIASIPVLIGLSGLFGYLAVKYKHNEDAVRYLGGLSFISALGAANSSVRYYERKANS